MMDKHLKTMTAKEIYDKLRSHNKDSFCFEFYSSMRFVAVDDIMEEADKFECCPYCGSENLDAHYCNDCSERHAEPEDAYWFKEKIKKMLKEVDKNESKGFN
ncbi:MAG: hypothetical protein ACOCP4_04475 [Candidatus Woesearchaeota archaeon]